MIYFNRDEQKSRRPGEPPRIISQGRVKVLCPIDPEKGGTWFAANDEGLVVALLNQYSDKKTRPKNPKSRGNLVLDVAATADRKGAHKVLFAAATSGRYPPFTVLVWHQGEVGMWTWANSKFKFNPDPTPLITSSSWETDRVESWRKDFYDDKVTGEGWSPDKFHRHSIPGDEASSVCMMREKTQTVSLTTCRVTDREVEMSYFPRDREGNFGSEDTASMPINPLL